MRFTKKVVFTQGTCKGDVSHIARLTVVNLCVCIWFER